MSASPMARQVSGVGIPTRRVVINNESDMPTNYGTTPGGTMFAHTPGGTRIVYERAFLIHMRESPLAKSPPTNLPVIPGVTVPAASASAAGSPGKSHSPGSGSECPNKLQTVKEEESSNNVGTKDEEADQFDMDV